MTLLFTSIFTEDVNFARGKMYSACVYLSQLKRCST